MKFVTTVDEDGNEELFQFPRSIDHDAMAEVLGRIKDQTHGNWKRVRRVPIAAGFVDSSGCYGKSETLHLKARPEDSKLLAKQACAA